MSSSCFSDLIRKLEDGCDPEELIPWTFTGSKENFIELGMIYLKYGKDPCRMEAVRRKLKEC